MKFSLSFLMLAVSIFFQSAHADSEKMKSIFTGKLSWAGNYSVHLELPEGWNDPGEFSHLTILKDKTVVFELKDLQAERMSSSRADPAGTKDLGGHNKMGELLKMIPLDKKHKVWALALSDWIGGSSDNNFILLAKDDSSDIYQAFKESITIAKIADYNGDGKLDVLKQGGRGEPSYGFSYDPYLVYKQTLKNGRIVFEIDDQLSQKWSAENHFEWHGNHYDERLNVDKDGKIMPVSPPKI